MHQTTTHTATDHRTAHLKSRYDRVVAMRAADPNLYKPSPLGAKFKTRGERYNDVLGHLRLCLRNTWDLDASHRLRMEDRMAALTEHILRERAMAAALCKIPLIGGERLMWAKLDQAHNLVREVLDHIRGHAPFDMDDYSMIDEVDVLSEV